MRIQLSLVLAALCFSTPAFATDVKLLTDDGQNPLTHVLEQENGAYTYFAAIGEDAKTLTLDQNTAAQVARIEYTPTTSWAVGEDGPWWPIPNSGTKPVWKNISLTEFKDGKVSVPVDDKDETVSLSQKTIDDAKAVFKTGQEMMDPERWIALIGKCDGSEISPCYSYMSERHFRYTLKSGETVLVTIHYPGGC